MCLLGKGGPELAVGVTRSAPAVGVPRVVSTGDVTAAETVGRPVGGGGGGGGWAVPRQVASPDQVEVSRRSRTGRPTSWSAGTGRPSR